MKAQRRETKDERRGPLSFVSWQNPIRWPLLGLALLLGFNALTMPGFFHVEMANGHLVGSLIDVLERAVPVLLVALGMTLVIGTGGVDLSVGAVMAISGAVAAGLIANPSGTPFANLTPATSLFILMAVPIIVSGLAGLFNGGLVVFGVQPIVATLILMVSGRGIAQLLTNGQIVVFSEPSFSALGSGYWLAIPIPVWIFVVSGLVLWLLARRTAFGLLVAATGSSQRAAFLCGVKTNAIKLGCYAVCAALAGVAGLIECADIKGADGANAGLYIELDAILAVSLGGTALTGGKFNLAGTVVGALLMQTLKTTIDTRGVPLDVTLVAKALIVIVVCWLQFKPVMVARAA